MDQIAKYTVKNSKVVVCLTLLCFVCDFGYAQDIEPRRWSSLPLKSNIFGAGYAYTFGELLFDPVLETQDVTLSINTIVLSYVKPFKIGNKQSRLDIVLPYSWQLFEGLLQGEPASVYRNGFGDTRIRFSINFSGAPPGTATEQMEYAKNNPVNTTFGASISVTLPTGQYFEEKLINIGQNQVVFRPQIGMVHNWRSWSYELTGSIFIFTNNNNFFGGNTRQQDPIFAAQTHLIKRFSSKIWASISASYGLGGESEVDGVSRSDFRTNFLSALSVGTKITKFASIKFTYLNSATLKDVGSNTNSFILGCSYLIL
ncbi:MAG: transporter [Bacteroidota bacterium]